MGNVISLADKIKAGVKRGEPDECWEWQKNRIKRGYGQLGHMGKALMAHRVAWEVAFGPIPEGLQVCHSCDNPPCCNPAHLWLGTQADNNRDMVAKGRARKGPPFGETSYRSKLSAQQVALIRSLPKNTNWAALSRTMGVTRNTVAKIARGERRPRG